MSSTKIKWRQRFEPAVILNRIDAIRTVGTDGRVSFSGINVDEMLTTLESMLEFPSGMHDIQPSVAVWRALGRIKGALTPDSVRDEVAKFINEQNSKSLEEYHVRTSVSMDTTWLPRKLERGDGVIEFPRPRSLRRYDTPEYDVCVRKSPAGVIPASYSPVLVHVRAKSPEGAFARAMRILDTERAMWALWCNSQMELFGAAWHPINKIRLGGTHTIHKPSGALAADSPWFEPNFVAARPHSPNKPKELQARIRKLRRRLAQSPYGGTLREALL